MVSVGYLHPEGHVVYVRLYAPIARVRINSNYVSGYTTPNTEVNVLLKDSSGTIKATETRNSYHDGYFYAYFDVLIAAGDSVEVTPAVGEMLSLDVPILTAEADLDADTVSGTAPASSTIRVEVNGGYQAWYWIYLDVTTDGSGSYVADFSDKVDITRGDWVYASYTNPDDNIFYLNFCVPILRVRINNNYVSGYTTPNTEVTLVLKDSSGSVKATETRNSYYDGHFYAYFEAEGEDIPIIAGDTVEVTPDVGEVLSVEVPVLTVQADIDADTVYGMAPPDSTIGVMACGECVTSAQPPPAPVPYCCYYHEVKTDSDGNYFTDFSKQLDITAGSKIESRYFDANDNLIYIYWEPGLVNLSILPPKMNVTLGQIFTVDIQAEAGEQPVAGIQAFINFNPTCLEVQDADTEVAGVQIAPGSDLPLVITNSADNISGTIDYVAGVALTESVTYPDGTFTVATIQFKALAETDATSITFSADSPRGSSVDYAGGDITGTLRGATVGINPPMVEISVILQGSSRPDPEGWVVPITLKFFSPEANVLSDSPLYEFNLTTDKAKADDTAICQCTGVTPDTYDITTVSEHTLMNVRSGVAISAAYTLVDMCTLLEGNANDDNIINISDFGILAVSFMTLDGEEGYDAKADFERNGIIDIHDFGMLAVNFMKTSPVECAD